jgi:hypothetical protein
MRKIYHLLQITCFMLCGNFIVAQALSGAYTIGSNAADYPTFATAIADLQTNGVGSGGATFTIQPGVYNENILLENISGLDATSRLTFFAVPGSVTMKNTGTPISTDAFIRINSLSYVTFDGLKMEDMSVTGQEIEFGYYFLGKATAGCSDNIIKNGEIMLGASGARPIVATRGIYFSSLGTNLATSNSNNLIDNMKIDNTSWGVYFRCASNFFGTITQPDFNNQVINSTFGSIKSLGHDFSGGALGINALGGRNMIIQNNVIESITNLNSAPGLPVSTTGISLDSCSGVVTQNKINYIEYQGTIGSVFGIRSSTFLGDSTLITNNKISGLVRSNFTGSTTDPSLTITGIWIFSQGTNKGLAKVYHNSIYLKSDAPVSYSSGGVNLSGGSTGKFPGEVYNNIIINTISTSAPVYKSFGLVDGNTNRGYLLSDHNNLLATGDNGFLGVIGRELGGTEQATNNLADFITISQTNENSVNFLPDFVNENLGDLSFASTITPTPNYFVPTLADVTVDIVNFTRTSPSTFAGAYEKQISLAVNNFARADISVYPNPATDYIKISGLQGQDKNVEIAILDSTGRVILTKKQLSNTDKNSEIRIDIHQIKTGLYFLVIKHNNQTYSKKLLVK